MNKINCNCPIKNKLKDLLKDKEKFFKFVVLPLSIIAITAIIFM